MELAAEDSLHPISCFAVHSACARGRHSASSTCLPPGAIALQLVENAQL